MNSQSNPIITRFRWRRLDLAGTDTCRLEEHPGRWDLVGETVFADPRGEARLQYQLSCDREWRSRIGSVRGRIGDETIDIRIAHESDGRWTRNGKAVHGLDGLLDLDYAFTPATNLPQLKRVHLEVGESAHVPAAWFDLDTGRLTRLEQIYERRSPSEYWYESPTTGYEGMLVIDVSGFAQTYPGLWEAA